MNELCACLSKQTREENQKKTNKTHTHTDIFMAIITIVIMITPN